MDAQISYYLHHLAVCTRCKIVSFYRSDQISECVLQAPTPSPTSAPGRVSFAICSAPSLNQTLMTFLTMYSSVNAVCYSTQLTSPTNPNKVFTLGDTSRSWTNAQQACIAAGGNLASIADQQEYNAFLSTFTGGPHWIGLNDVSQEGTWVWADGSTSTFRRWGVNEPNSYQGTDEDCVEVVSTSDQRWWNDAPCSNVYAYVCVKYLQVTLSKQTYCFLIFMAQTNSVNVCCRLPHLRPRVRQLA